MVDTVTVEKVSKLLENFDLFQDEIKYFIDQISQEYPNYREALLEAFEDEDVETLQDILEKIRFDLMNQETEDEVQEEENNVVTTIQIGDQKISVQFVLPKKKGIAG